MLPEPIKKFSELFARLPSIGPRQAIRLAFHIKNLGATAIDELAGAIAGLGSIKTCARCFFSFLPTGRQAKDKNLCEICSNPQRRKDIVAIVEKETDLMSLEKTHKFNGRYLVLGDLQKDGVLDAAQKLRLSSLKSSIQKDLGGQVEEIIIAINPTTYGDINANLISQELKGLAKKTTRLGRGIPTGGEIEFADEETLGSAIDNRN